MNWSLLGCARSGHLSYAPDEPDLRARLSVLTAAGESWRCLRCGTFVPGSPTASGPAASAPAVVRGEELRSAFILRVFAVERFARAIVFGALAYGVWRFKYSRTSIERAFNKELPALRTLFQQLGYNINHSKLVGLIQDAFTLTPRTITWLAVGLVGYTLLELVEGIGLWLVKRWGEYFAMVATSAFLPLEIIDLTSKVTVVRVLAFAVNLLLVIYLVTTKRLFGVRGGHQAYVAKLRSESILDTELAQLKKKAQPAVAREPTEPSELIRTSDQPGPASQPGR
jgi:uncharacterized membrane protein (DUF2068 family)